jgi:hypothetical protein
VGANEDDSKTWDSSTYIPSTIPNTCISRRCIIYLMMFLVEIMLKTLLYLCLFFKYIYILLHRLKIIVERQTSLVFVVASFFQNSVRGTQPRVLGQILVSLHIH